MAVTCPKCGKPVRPGSKFCSKCGAEMPGTLPLSKMAQPAPPTPPDLGACPHCGKPIRPGAKFCPNCGKGIAAAEAPAAPPATDSTASTPQPPAAPAAEPVPPAPQVKTTPQPAAGAPPKTGAEAARGKHPGGKKWLLLVIAGVLLLACLALIITAFFLRDQLPIPFLQNATETPTVTATATETITPTLEPSSTSTAIPTHTVTVAPTATATPAVTGTETAGTTAPEAPAALFKDDFAAGWEKNWIAWGAPPVVGGESISLSLESAALNDAGIATRETIAIEEGVTFEFSIKLNGTSPQDVIFFDWSAGKESRKAGDPPGTIHAQIGAGVMQLGVADSADTYKSCAPKPFSGVDVHIYQITIEPDWRLVFKQDGKEVCALQAEPYTGSAVPAGILSFTGRGTLDDIRVDKDER